MSDFQNPQQDPGMERRLLLAFALTFLVIVLSQPLINRYARAPQAEPAATPAAPAVQPAAATPSAVTSSAGPVATPPLPPEIRQANAESLIVVENDLYRITFTNRGAQVKSWVLKKYKDHKGQPLELVHAQAASQYGHPLSLWTYDKELRKKLGEVLYVPECEPVPPNGLKPVGGQAETTPAVLCSPSAPAEVAFEYADGETRVRKSFRFDHSYVVEVETETTFKGATIPAYPAWPAGFGDQHLPIEYAATHIVVRNGSTIQRLEAKKVSGGNTMNGPFHWAGVAGQYFGAVFLPEDPQNAVMVTLHEALDIPNNPEKPEPGKTTKVDVLGVALGSNQASIRQRVFVGPKAVDVLQAVQASLTPDERKLLGADAKGPDLEPLVDFGEYLGFIARPIFLWLKWTYEHWAPNWGLSIIILTVIINIALFPLRLSSMKSALKMQKIAPQMRAIQEKYGKYKFNDPRRQAMGEEQMALYKKEGVNPVGGCVPMLLQVPFLFAFYTVLTVAIELRHAPWLWIKDLSAADPYYLLPVGFVGSMFVLQRLTPQGTMDPMQQKMMNIMMPVMLGFVSINLASGLCVYWSVGNLISIVQQLVVNRTAFGREVRAEIEKRAARKK
ncbi:MAG: membrane protein insertase YidC [Terriglobales bacterium]